MKKQILFVIESLTLGGAEKSLVTLLNLMDYSKYDVDLLLFSQGGAFQALLPNEVNILPVPDYFSYSSVPWHKISQKLLCPDKMLAQIHYSLALRMGEHNHIEKAVMLWQICKKCFSPMRKSYNVAVAYAQGLPTFFVADKVKAEKKFAWVNTTYIPTGKYLKYVKNKYINYDVVNGVSEGIEKKIQEVLEIPANKTTCIKDILDVDLASKMAELKSCVHKDMATNSIKILTVGRFAARKRYDLAVEAAKLLVDADVDFIWYAIGDGSLKSEIKKKIVKNGIEKNFVLLGKRSNPYPYFKACDLYVQTSDVEGFGITLAEAKMFAKPIVTTNFPVVREQFENEKNGLIVDISAQAIADGIVRMLTDTQLRQHCITNVSKEKIGNVEEIEKFYREVES